MAAVKLDLVVEQGVTYEKDLLWQDEFGVAIDLTGYTARMQIRHKVESQSVLVSLLDTAGIALGGAAGTIGIEISSDVTDVIQHRDGVYDLELVAPDGKVTRLIEGKVTFVKGVTR